MEYPNQLGLCRDAFITIGSSAGGLIGLLFIAASLHVKEIANNPVFYQRAINHSCYLLIVLGEVLFIFIPQPLHTLGIELVATNAIGLWIVLRFAYIFFENAKAFRSGGGSVQLALIFGASFLVGAAGGAVLIGHEARGAYLVATSCASLLVGVVLACWSIMAGVARKTFRARGRKTSTKLVSKGTPLGHHFLPHGRR